MVAVWKVHGNFLAVFSLSLPFLFDRQKNFNFVKWVEPESAKSADLFTEEFPPSLWQTGCGWPDPGSRPRPQWLEKERAGRAGEAEVRDRPTGGVPGPERALGWVGLPGSPDGCLHVAHFLRALMGGDGAHLLLRRILLLHGRLCLLPLDVEGALVQGLLRKPVLGRAGEVDPAWGFRSSAISTAQECFPRSSGDQESIDDIDYRW